MTYKIRIIIPTLIYYRIQLRFMVNAGKGQILRKMGFNNAPPLDTGQTSMLMPTYNC